MSQTPPEPGPPAPPPELRPQQKPARGLGGDVRTPPENPAAPTGDPGLQHAHSWLLRGFLIVIAINALGLLWLAVRASGPESLKNVHDFLLNVSLGAVVAAAALRVLFLFPLRTTDLLAIVFTLAVWLRFTLGALNGFQKLGLLGNPQQSQAEAGLFLQFVLISMSVLIGGGALGLWACKRRRLDGAFSRALTVSCAMLALPAMAGLFACPVVAYGALLVEPKQEAEAFIWMAAWFVALPVTLLNVFNWIKAASVQEEIGAQEKMS